MEQTTIVTGLRLQALDFRGTGPHPHNRKPVETTMRTIRTRSRRRRANQAIRQARDLFSWRWEVAG